MKSIVAFFSQLTIGKKVLLSLTPLISLIFNMKPALIALFLLIFIDLLTGIRKNHYKKGVNFTPLKKIFWISIKSYLLRKTWRKVYEYIFGILAMAVFEVYILGHTQIEVLGKTNLFTEWAVVIGGTIELWSIFENMEAVSGSNPLKRVLNVLPKNIKKLFINSEKDNT